MSSWASINSLFAYLKEREGEREREKESERERKRERVRERESERERESQRERERVGRKFLFIIWPNEVGASETVQAEKYFLNKK